MLEIIKLKHNSPEWLEFRRKGIGASEAAAAIGLSRWKSNIELWEEKVGIREPQDISNSPRVKYGNDAEKPLFELFKFQYAEIYTAKVNKRVVYRKDGFQFASLDGELVERSTSNKGVWECKTVIADNSLVWAEWRDQLPQQYYIQLLHQLMVTGWKFSVINPEFRWTDESGEVRTSVRRYRLNIDDEQVKADIRYLDEAEHEFWDYVKRRERPPLICPQI